MIVTVIYVWSGDISNCFITGWVTPAGFLIVRYPCHIQMTPVVYRQAYEQQDTLKTVSKSKFESKLSNFDWRVR